MRIKYICIYKHEPKNNKQMKHEWKKKEKNYYLPKSKPEFTEIPEFNFFTINGTGNPNSKEFAKCIEVLYSLSYAIKMSPKKGIQPEGYFDYTVYPLEGIWDLNKEAQENFNGTLNKDDLVYTLMIRQPDFVDKNYASRIIEITKVNKPHELLDQVKFESIFDGNCVQMMHVGSYDNEPESFKLMEKFSEEKGLKRKSKVHREIYLSDFRKTATYKLKTILRFLVE